MRDGVGSVVAGEGEFEVVEKCPDLSGWSSRDESILTASELEITQKTDLSTIGVDKQGQLLSKLLVTATKHPELVDSAMVDNFLFRITPGTLCQSYNFIQIEKSLVDYLMSKFAGRALDLSEEWRSFLTQTLFSFRLLDFLIEHSKTLPADEAIAHIRSYTGKEDKFGLCFHKVKIAAHLRMFATPEERMQRECRRREEQRDEEAPLASELAPE